ncbi:MAG: LytTR family DNA-binding domain-containing protein [Clostridia bacterium]|nr:LytTR family DNA-binding domain-containing protein [Clostridia bacterium]
MIKLAVCDDEKEMCEYLHSFSLDWFADHDIDACVTEFYDGDSLVSHYEQKKEDFDIVLLDIKMKNLNGMSAAKEIRRLGSKSLIVFITSSIEYVFRGYEVKAFRYILKNELKTSFERILRDCVQELKAENRPVFAFKCDREDYCFELQDILYFESERRIIKVYTENDEVSFYDKLSSVEDKLKDSDFVRIHQSFLVNAKRIKNISGLTLTLQNGKELPISKSKLKKAKEAYLWSLR